MRFRKYHGLGNDFLVVDRRAEADAAPLAPDVVRRLCDRHRGVGGDGVLSIWPLPGGHGRMQVQNADGSESGMCGNGLRCVARYLHDAGVVEETLLLGAGERRYAVTRVAPERYRVDMGRAVLTHAELPVDASPTGEVSVSASGRTFAGTVVHMGNPHLVLFCDGEAPRALAEQYGPVLERHAAFPARTNVSFVAPSAQGFEAVVFERGVGMTQACGSAACAVAVAAAVRGRAPFGQPCVVHLLGGPLVIVVSAALEVTMEGEAVRVFSGDVELA